MQRELFDTPNGKNCEYDDAWNDCPPELLLMILDFLSGKSNVQTLLNCLAVNKKWWNVGSALIQRRMGYQDMFKRALSDRGASFRKRSLLPSIPDYIRNLSHWKDIHFTQISGNYIYDITEVVKVNVYKDKIIVVTNRAVQYYHLKTHKLIKTLPIRCSDFDENQFMFIKVQAMRVHMDNIAMDDLTVYGKLDDDSEMDEDNSFTTKIKFFKVYDNCCYFINFAFTISILKWENDDWTTTLVGRYYGYGIITDVIVHHKDIVALLNWGGMLIADIKNYKLKLISRKKTSVIFELPTYASKSVLYERHGAIATVPGTYPLTLNCNGLYWILECPDLMCSLNHANMLFLGYKNGKVEIYNPDDFSSNRLQTKLTLTVQSLAPFDYEMFDPSVRHIEASEVKGGHVLIIVTSIYIHQVTLDHRLGDLQVSK